MTPFLRKALFVLLGIVVVLGGLAWWVMRGDPATQTLAQSTGLNPTLAEPDPQWIPTLGIATPSHGRPVKHNPGAGLAVTRFVDGLNHPRAIYTLPNGDVLVAESNGPKDTRTGFFAWAERTVMSRVGAGGPSPNTIRLLRDSDGDGVADQKFVFRTADLNSPFGMAWKDGTLYVANTNAVLAFAFTPGATVLEGKPTQLMALPAAGRHWVRNLQLSPDGKQLYVTVGSASNIAEDGIEKEEGRATIWEYDFARKSAREYASGLRNPNGLAFHPTSGELWTTVNERDQLGSDLVPDYLTNVPLGAHYGWPWLYWKTNMDDRVKPPLPQDLYGYVRKPEYALGAHVAALGLVFSAPERLTGAKFARGAFVARHGSWNRKPMSGYDVVFVGFDELGNPLDAQPLPVLTGFLSKDEKHTHGRPTWLAWDKAGALLVSDDVGGVIWRVTAKAAPPAKP